jgi:hypothetical protein
MLDAGVWMKLNNSLHRFAYESTTASRRIDATIDDRAVASRVVARNRCNDNSVYLTGLG